MTVINCLASGLTQKETANTLRKGETTIKQTCRHMREYFGAATNIEAVLMARREWKLDL